MSGDRQPGAALVGAVLAHSYRLTRLVGRGGMGAVYEGQHLRLGQRVAIKVMAADLAASREALARFRREAEVTSRIRHPHIVHVFDVGSAPSGEPFLVMEYLDGEDLEHRIARLGKLSIAAAVHIVKQTAAALAAAHGQGIVHRDLKPANIFLLELAGEADFVKIVDFGISKVKAATTKLTRSSVVMGTPDYMSPEQARGRIDEIDHRTDQWALAAITYEMLCGRAPFAGEDVASVLYQVTREEPEPLSSRAPGVPLDFERALTRALAKRAVERFPSISDFARALEQAAGASTSPAGETRSRLPGPRSPTSRQGTVAYGRGSGLAAESPAPPGPFDDLTMVDPRPPVVTRNEPKKTTFSHATGEARSSWQRLRNTRRMAIPAGLSAILVATMIILAFRWSRQPNVGAGPEPRPVAAATRPVISPLRVEAVFVGPPAPPMSKVAEPPRRHARPVADTPLANPFEDDASEARPRRRTFDETWPDTQPARRSEGVIPAHPVSPPPPPAPPRRQLIKEL
jgi:serine/threonine protein kinase